MKRRVFGVGMVATLAVAGCSTTSGRGRFKTYDGPEVTSVLLNKGDRKLYLFNNDVVMKQYRFDLGFAPVGDKKIEGDGKTPEGNYIVDKRNPNSAFHLSVGISYPDEQDIAEAELMGKSPGGDIFIHGQPNTYRAKGADWTAGCIAVRNREIQEIYAMVKNGTPITLTA
jgi:murein L,D-transpeptidase YafK